MRNETYHERLARVEKRLGHLDLYSTALRAHAGVVDAANAAAPLEPLIRELVVADVSTQLGVAVPDVTKRALRSAAVWREARQQIAAIYDNLDAQVAQMGY